MSKNTGGSAFPLPNGTETTIGTEGMTLRDYFAGQALDGLCSTTLNPMPKDQSEAIKLRALLAYKLADAMIEAREADGAAEDAINNFNPEAAKDYALLERAAEQACERVRKDILPTTQNPKGRHPLIDRVCALIHGWEYRVPEDRMHEIKCPYMECDWGQGLGGSRKCSGYGNPMDANCPNFTTEAGDYSTEAEGEEK